MIIVDVKLDAYGEGVCVKPLARVLIANDGTSTDPKRGSYSVRALRKPSKRKPYSVLRVNRRGRVENHPRQSAHVLTLLRKSLQAMGY